MRSNFELSDEPGEQGLRALARRVVARRLGSDPSDDLSLVKLFPFELKPIESYPMPDLARTRRAPCCQSVATGDQLRYLRNALVLLDVPQ